MKYFFKNLLKAFDRGIEITDKIINKCGGFLGSTFSGFFKFFNKFGFGKIVLVLIILFFIFGGGILIWVTSFELPDLENFENRKVAQSTKIYDRTGDVVLFDVHGEITRTVVPLDQINDYAKWATIAIEDANFYNHKGIEPKAIARAIYVNLKNRNLLGGQGGSTITQQVIKNALLTSDKKVSRKIKEWVLAPRLEKHLSKDEILEVYLNEVPYGGTVYGIQEASRRFFSKDAKDITLAESSYLAALPQAPTFYSPFGNNTDRLEFRKNKVLDQMLVNNFITQEEYDSAKNEHVVFEKPENFGIKAPHFVFWIREQLEEKYGVEAIEQGGLKIITTLDWEIQEKAEEIVKRKALENKEKFDAENASIVAIDPKNGQVLTMVGSRDYFDKEIDGNFNITTANRQPGSAFKPIVYAEAFNKGYRPETVVFDLPTQFSATCEDDPNTCYSPVNYDNTFKGPMSLRNALAQSVNIPAVKTLYLAGIKDSLNLAINMGAETLANNINQYGLTLVLGGGEVRPLDMTSVYTVFANEGIKHNPVGILKVEDSNGKTLEEFEENSRRVLPVQTARLISDVLSDNVARTPAFGSSSHLNFPSTDVAAKTGTTNDYRDAWIVGYTPSISVAAWAGNNDNRSMDKKVAGFIVAPMWNEFMQVAIEKYPGGEFTKPEPIQDGIKPIIAGLWRGEEIVTIDNKTGEEADNDTDEEDKKRVAIGGGEVHSILYWVDKKDPLGPKPNNPFKDSQFGEWEKSVLTWANKQGFSDEEFEDEDGNKKKSKKPKINFGITYPSNNDFFYEDQKVLVAVRLNGSQLSGGDVFVNNKSIGVIDITSNSFSVSEETIKGLVGSGNTLKVIGRDILGNTYEDKINFSVLER